jgi:hypothetical protein
LIFGGYLSLALFYPRPRVALYFFIFVGGADPRDRDGGARRKILAEQFAAEFRHPRGVARVDQEHRHGHQIGERGAGFGQRLLDVAERLPELGVEVAGQRLAGVVHLAGMAGDPQGSARTFRDNHGRECPLLLPGAAHE